MLAKHITDDVATFYFNMTVRLSAKALEEFFLNMIIITKSWNSNESIPLQFIHFT